MLTIEERNQTLRVATVLTAAAELPTDSVISSPALRRNVDASIPRVLELNLARHIGPIILNGLLGARWTPDQTGLLKVKVRHGNAKRVSRGTLADGWSEPIGAQLINSWAEQVLLTAVEEVSKSQMPSGTLEFSHAGSGEVGSTDKVFCELTTWIVRLLQLPPDELDLESVRSLTLDYQG